MIKQFRKYGVIPVVVIENAEESICLMHEKYTNMLVSAGTVLTISQVDKVIVVWLKFVVSPAFDLDIVNY